MNPHLQEVLKLIQQDDNLDVEQIEVISGLLKSVDKELTITAFKLDRTEKVKRTTAILLEETIEELEQKRKTVEESHEALKKSMEELKAAQVQLIHAEKMASLGELTAGIAHEIQNPLNFVNNFSEVSVDLIDELNEEIDSGNAEEVKSISGDLKSNLQKISHHGKRASGIVRGMLEHSRSGSGEKVPTNINALADEYLRLAYHGLRAKDKSFNAEIKTDFDESLPNINVVAQDIGRVLLNLFNNAFYAVSDGVEKIQEFSPPAPPPQVGKDAMHRVSTHNPTLTLTTFNLGDKIEIRVKDNGNGIPDEIKDKIFQPFFTTKPTGQGTGLGLSMSYDIITKGHGGKLDVQTKEGEGTEFIIILPLLDQKQKT